MIDAEIDTQRPRLDLHAPADKEALPLVRQALRALGQSVGAEAQALHDAELAVTEACANAVRHAYKHSDGVVDVTLEARPTDVLAIVRDSGCGIGSRQPRRGSTGGLGLTLIQSVTREVEIRTERGAGTEVVMALPIRTPELTLVADPFASSPVARLMRRLVAMAAAQTEMSPERITDALLVAEIVARHAPERLIDGTVRVQLEQLPNGIELRIGLLEAGGTAAILEDAAMPIVGSIVERLADEIYAIPPASEQADEGEQIALRFAA